MRCNIIIMMYRPRSISSPLCYCYHITENILPFTTLRYLLPWTWDVMQCSLLMISDQFRRPSGWQEESCLFPTPRCWWMDVVIVQWYLDSSHTETTNATCCIPHTHRLPMIDNKCYREWDDVSNEMFLRRRSYSWFRRELPNNELEICHRSEPNGSQCYSIYLHFVWLSVPSFCRFAEL